MTAEVSGRLYSIDALRGGAALAVVLLHVPHNPPADAPTFKAVVGVIDQVMMEGVWLFMVISGFCIHLAVAKRMSTGQPRGRGWGAFWRRRMVRLYPPYVAAVALGLVVYYVCGPVPNEPFPVDYPGWDALTHLLMVHDLFTRYWGGVGNGPLWTLGVEEKLYALYAVYLLVRLRTSARVALTLVLCVSTAWIVLVLKCYQYQTGPEPFEVGMLPWWPFRYWFLWCAGAVAAEAYAGAIALPDWAVSRTALIAALGALAGTYVPLSILGFTGTAGKVGAATAALAHNTLFGVAAGLLILNGARSEAAGAARGRVVRAFSRLGIFSYSLYITHAPVLRVLDATWGIDPSAEGTVIRYAVWPPICIGCSYLFFLAIEQWFLTAPKPATLPAPQGVPC